MRRIEWNSYLCSLGNGFAENLNLDVTVSGMQRDGHDADW